MKIKELHNELQKMGFSDRHYFLHGLYGSTDDNDKIALTITRGKYSVQYIVYYKERGEKHSEKTFATEDEACKYILKKFREELKNSERNKTGYNTI